MKFRWLFLGLVIFGLLAAKPVKADEYCGYGSRCQSSVYRGVNYIPDRACGKAAGYCSYTTQQKSGQCWGFSGALCPGGGKCCGFWYDTYPCRAYPGCASQFTQQFYSCCVCEDVEWSACSVSCGGGTQTSNCGNTRECNTQPCEFCGDSSCNGSENCSSCAGDCGACSCSLTLLPGVANIALGEQTEMTANVVPGNGPVGQGLLLYYPEIPTTKLTIATSSTIPRIRRVHKPEKRRAPR